MDLDPNYQFVHSTGMDFGRDGYAMVINEKNVDTGESRLRILTNPIRPFWITKPNARHHSEKKEFAHVSELDMIQVPHNQLKIELAKRLGVYKGPNAYYNARDLFDNPYVYGADIDPEVIIRLAYKKKCRRIKSYNVGFLDIETSVFGDEQVNVMTYIDQNFVIHTGVLKMFMQQHDMNDIVTYRDRVWHDVVTSVNEDTKKAVIQNRLHQEDYPEEIKEEWIAWTSSQKKFEDLSPRFKILIDDTIAHLFSFDIEIFEREYDLLVWSMKNIHRTKPDFVGIWNMDFDIPYLINRFTVLGLPPQDAFSHPEVPKRLHFLKYHKDPGKKGQHFTDKWHWLYAPGYTKYIDSMNLYSRIRKVDGRENSYKLDFISNKEIGIGKMPVTTHEDMQENHFVEYVVYNMVDAAVLTLMEILNHDMESLMGLAYISPLQEFAHQTKMLTNNFYEYCRLHSLVPASTGGSQLKPTDEFIYNVGGAVLEPTNIRDAGLPILLENGNITNLFTMVCDIDVASMYPSTMIAFNISKQTKILTCFGIEGCKVIFGKKKGKENKPSIVYDPVNDFFMHVSAPTENAVWLGKKFFNLLDYQEALALYQQYKQNKVA